MSPNIRRCGNEKANGVSGSIMIEHQARVDVKAMGYTFQGIEVFLMDSVPAFRRGTFHAIIGGDIIKRLPEFRMNYATNRLKVPRLRIHTVPPHNNVNIQILENELSTQESAMETHNMLSTWTSNESEEQTTKSGHILNNTSSNIDRSNCPTKSFNSSNSSLTIDRSNCLTKPFNLLDTSLTLDRSNCPTKPFDSFTQNGTSFAMSDRYNCPTKSFNPFIDDQSQQNSYVNNVEPFPHFVPSPSETITNDQRTLRHRENDFNMFEIEIGKTFNARDLNCYSAKFDDKRGKSLIREIERKYGDLPENEFDKKITDESDECFTEIGEEIKPDPNLEPDPTYKINYDVCKCTKEEVEKLRELIESYPECVAIQKYDIGLAKVEQSISRQLLKNQSKRNFYEYLTNSERK